MNVYTIPLNAIEPAAFPLVGGKAFNLHRLFNAGLPVPGGFAITSVSMLDFFTENCLQEEVDAYLAAPSEEALEQLRASVMRSDFPESLHQDLLARWQMLAGKRFACRSSAVHEDGGAASYAGHYESWLNLTTFDQLLEATKLCWVSFYAGLLHQAYGASDLEPYGMGVVAQEMIVPLASGVMFTCIETEQGDKVGIESVFGMGEGLVSGIFQPDQFVLSRENGQTDFAKIAEKFAMFFPNLTPGTHLLYGDTVEVGGAAHQVIRESGFSNTLGVFLNEEWLLRESLTETQRVQLWQIALRAEQFFGHPQDMEWAVDAHSGTVYVVQSRPITSIVWWELQAEEGTDSNLMGDVASRGIATGKVRILNPEDSGETLQQGEILVTYQTFPKWYFAMARSAAVVTQTGGILSHAAIVSRELGKPCLTGVRNATTTLHTGDVITVDAEKGLILLSQNGQQSEGGQEVEPDLCNHWAFPGDSQEHPEQIATIDKAMLLHWVLMNSLLEDNLPVTAKAMTAIWLAPYQNLTYVAHPTLLDSDWDCQNASWSQSFQTLLETIDSYVRGNE